MRRVLVISHTYLQPTHRGKLRALAARRLGIPVVMFTHQNVELQLDWWLSWKHRRMLRRLAGLIAGSDLAGSLVRGHAPRLPSAVSRQLGAVARREPQHVPHEGLAIGFVGRLVPQKGLDNLLQALALQRAAKWRLTIVGDGPDRERLEQLATELRLAARVRWTGGLPAEHVANLWPELDVLVLPSRSSNEWRETNGQVLMEAMANEVAVMGTNSGVIPELIGDAGIVVPDGDLQAMAGAVERLSDQATRRGLAQAARARALRLYSDDAIAERTLTFWQQVAK